MFGRNKKKNEYAEIEMKEPLTPGDVIEPVEEVVVQPKEVIEPKVIEAPPVQPVKKEIVVDEKEKDIFQVVKELPMQPVRKVKTEDGKIINLIIIEEALTEIMNS